eukprot:g909.t1
MKILPLPRSRPSEDRAADMEKRGILPPPGEGILPLPPPGVRGVYCRRRVERPEAVLDGMMVEGSQGEVKRGAKRPPRSQRTGAGASSRDRGVAAGKGTVLPPPAGSGSGIASQRRTKKPPASQYRGKEFYANFSSGGGSSASAKAEGDDPESGDVEDLGDFDELMNGAGADDDLNPFTEENLEIFAEVGEEDIQDQSSDGEKCDGKYDWAKYDMRDDPPHPSEFSNKWSRSREGSEADGMQGVSSEDAGLLGHGTL